MAALRIVTAHDIGSAAGKVWHYLNDNGPVTLAKLSKDLKEPRETLLQGVGWLAREGKIEFLKGKGKTQKLSLS